jgi:hypothetical protein
MAAKRPTVRSNKFQRVGEVSLDARKRVSLAKAIAALNGSTVKKSGANKNGDLRFEIHMNGAGQILLSPQVIHPEEAWLYKNPEALASVRRGLRQSASGKRYNLGSFLQYADDEID